MSDAPRLPVKVMTKVWGDKAGPLAPAPRLVSAGATAIEVMKASNVGDPEPAVARKPGRRWMEPPAWQWMVPDDD